MPPQTQTHSFTTIFDRITGALITDIHVTKAFYPEKKEKFEKPISIKGLWDTGATGSVITQKVVDALQLKAISMTKVNTASGESIQPVYLVGIGLPNKIMFNHVRVTQAPLTGGFDVLVGMDIIHRGDFAITNHNGKTVFSFRIPSVKIIDFVTEDKSQPPNMPQIGRNDPCYCNSGKKFKHCHGK